MEQNNALTVGERPESLTGRVRRMLEIQQMVMKKDIDYGIIPGCKKPSLYKPGAELLMATFGLADRITVEELPESDYIRYRVTTEIYSQQTEAYLGCGVGEASTNEDKYKWRAAVCDGEFEATEPDQRRRKWYRNGECSNQIRTNPSDLANTVLKMAKKRSKIDAVLSVLGASRIYTQDIDEMSRELQDMMAGESAAKKSTKPTVTQTTKPDLIYSEGKIEDINIKSGKKKNGGDYTRYGIKVAGKTLGTFDTTLGKKAEVAAENGEPVIVGWVKDGKFKNIKTLEVKEPVQRAGEEPVSDHESFCRIIKNLADESGITNIDVFIKEQVNIDGLDNVTAEQQNLVLGLFNYQVENAQ